MNTFVFLSFEQGWNLCKNKHNSKHDDEYISRVEHTQKKTKPDNKYIDNVDYNHCFSMTTTNVKQSVMKVIAVGRKW